MRRAVISDFGGVLTSPLSQLFRGYEERSGVKLEDIGRSMAKATEQHGEHPLFALEKGEIQEAEFWRRLEDGLEADVSLGGMRDHYFEQIEPNEPMIEFMRELRGRGLRMALLTNNVREWEPLWRSKLPEVDELFEVVVDSAFVGMRKPDPAIYELTLERLGDVTAAECVFVDDLEPNCETARTLGMHAVRFVGTDSAIVDIEAALSE